MARSSRFHISRSRKHQVAERLVGEAHDAGVLMNTSDVAGNRYAHVDGAQLLNFGSCSYLSLHEDESLKQGAIEATRQFGTQFSYSRAFLQCSLYQELEQSLSELSGGYALVSPSTSLGHLAALPVLIAEDDLVLIDQFAHASLHTATELLGKTEQHVLRHNRTDLIRELLESERERKAVWYICDGLYSMLGDFAPFDELRSLLDEFPNLHLYVDDAHSVSWCGPGGMGAALMALPSHPRMVVALSLNKAFSAAGGALIFPSEEQRLRIRRVGGPLLFSGPVQPPMLGAALASVRLHQSERLPKLQEDLMDRIATARHQLAQNGVQLATHADSPIFLVQCDNPPQTFRIVKELREAGYFTCPSVFPAVPVNKPSIRFTICRHNEEEDIVGLARTLGRLLREVYDETVTAVA